MANGIFGNDPSQTRVQGGNMVQSSEDFLENKRRLFEIVETLVERSYISDGARAIASNILSFDEELTAMGKVINAYGNYSLATAKSVVTNEQNISQTYVVNK